MAKAANERPLQFMNAAALILVTVVYAAISAYGLYLIKDAHALFSARGLVGALFYGGGFCIWIAMLRVFPLSIAFPIAAGSLIVATNLIARYFLGETISSAQMLGIGLIVAGIFLIFLRTTQ
ncbi:MAG: EamA family transporter [Bauldia sp.]